MFLTYLPLSHQPTLFLMFYVGGNLFSSNIILGAPEAAAIALAASSRSYELGVDVWLLSRMRTPYLLHYCYKNMQKSYSSPLHQLFFSTKNYLIKRTHSVLCTLQLCFSICSSRGVSCAYCSRVASLFWVAFFISTAADLSVFKLAATINMLLVFAGFAYFKDKIVFRTYLSWIFGNIFNNYYPKYRRSDFEFSWNIIMLMLASFAVGFISAYVLLFRARSSAKRHLVRSRSMPNSTPAMPRYWLLRLRPIPVPYYFWWKKPPWWENFEGIIVRSKPQRSWPLFLRVRVFIAAVLIPRVHYYASWLLRWPMLLLPILVVPVIILHTFEWFVQDYEQTYRNIFKNYRRADSFLSLSFRSPSNYYEKTLYFIAVVIRMYLDSLLDFCFGVTVYTFKYQRETMYLPLATALWPFLFIFFGLSSFLHGYSTSRWATARLLRLDDRKLPREWHFKLYYAVAFHRLKSAHRVLVPKHPDKGRTDFFLGALLLTPVTTLSIFTQRTEFFTWFSSWVVTFQCSQFLVMLFVLLCCILHAVTHYLYPLTRSLLYGHSFSLLWSTWNIALLALFVDLTRKLWSVWTSAYCPSMWKYCNIIVYHTPWYYQLYVIAVLSATVWFVISYPYKQKKKQDFIDYSRALYFQRTLTNRSVNRAALNRFLDIFAAAWGVPPKQVFRKPVVKAKRCPKKDPNEFL